MSQRVPKLVDRIQLTSLGRAKVLARSGGTRASTAGLLNAQSSTLDNFTLETVLGSISLVRSDHLHEPKATRLLSMGVLHDLALLNLAILLEEAGDLSLGKLGVDTSDEEVGAGVDRTIFIPATILLSRRTVVRGQK